MDELNVNNELMQMANTPKGDWFSPKAGTYQITVLKEPTKEDIRIAKFDDDSVEQVILNIKVKGAEGEKLWSVTKGKTSNSLWGQLCLFAKYENNGKFSGKEFQLIVKGEGKSKNYTVYESLKHTEKFKDDFKNEKGVLLRDYLEL